MYIYDWIITSFDDVNGHIIFIISYYANVLLLVFSLVVLLSFL